jgi:HD-GYP domain-containing protein (c-di-GMP phosphodiesterase class II)
MGPSHSQDTPLYNSRITNTYLKLIRKRYGHVDIKKLLAYADMELHQVEDEGHWFTQRQVNRFHKKLRELTGNSDIAREAGQFSASPEAMGGIAKYILGLVSPARAYALVGRYAEKFTRSTRVESRSLSPTTVEVVATPRPGVKEEPFQCENRKGYFESVSRLFNYKPPTIEHPECVFQGGDACRYIVSWQASPSTTWKRLRLLSLPLFLLAIGGTAAGAFPGISPLPMTFFSVIVFLLVSWYIADLDTRELRAAVGTLEQSSDDLVEQINVNYQNALMVNEIGQVLSKQSSIEEILDSMVNVLKRRLDYDRGLILLADEKKKRLLPKAGYGYPHYQLERFMAGGGFRLDHRKSRGIFVLSFREQKPFLVNDINEIFRSLSPRSLKFAMQMGAKSFICCPIVYENESLGILAVDNKRTKRPLLQRDVNLLMGVAPQIGVCLHNVKLVEARVSQFQSIIQVLVASTEARDPITAGHSLKVTEYAMGICRELGLSHEYTEMIRVAASLHDYGKIGVYDSILKKPGRLTTEEYEVVKTHAARTKDILKQVNFEGIYQEVPDIAGAHHEKMDGSGYPRRLKGEEIPFGARILAVADVFEALTSKRHYREPMPLEEVFDHIVENIGAHFDRECVEALIRYYNASEAETPYRYREPSRAQPGR